MPGERLEQIGIYHARVAGWSLQDSTKAGSKAKCINIRYEIIDQGAKNQDGEMAWSDQWPPGYEVYGRHYVIGTDGQIIHDTVARVMEAIGWSGKFQDIGRTPQEAGLKDCRIEVDVNTYKDKTYYQVEWLNPYDWEGSGGMTGADNASLLALDNERGAEMRAIAGKVQQESTAKAPAVQPGQPVVAAPPVSVAPPPPAGSGEP